MRHAVNGSMLELDHEGHSIGRFIERWFPKDKKPDRASAKALLEKMVRWAVYVEDDDDQEIWQVFDIKLTVKDGIVRTVLPKGAERPEGRRP